MVMKMFDRVLSMSLGDFVSATERFKWRFYEIDPDDESIRVEVPRGEDTLVLNIQKTDEHLRMLKNEGFIHQEIRPQRGL